MSGEGRSVGEEAERLGRLARTYGLLRGYFKSQPATRWAPLRRRLNRAHAAESYESYLARITLYALLVGFAGVVVGFLLLELLQIGGLVDRLRSPVPLGRFGPAVERVEVLVVSAVIAGVIGTVLAVGTWTFFYLRPGFAATTRRQEINTNLAQAITFMYALSRGGMNVVEVFRATAKSTDAYGAAAEEFGVIVRDIEAFNTSLLTALRNARDRTPSDEMARFFDDLVGVIESGGDLPNFLETQSERYLETAREEQRDFLETLSLFAEIYVTALVAGPLFLIIILMVIGLLGGSTLPQVSAVVYLGIPLGSVALLVLLDTLAAPYDVGGWRLETPRDEPEPPETDDSRLAAYERRQRVSRLRRWLSDPLGPFVERPALSLWLSVPAAAAVVAWFVATRRVDPSLAAFLERPIVETIDLVVVPFLVVATPLSALYEFREYRRRQYRSEFTDTISGIANANQIGIDLADSIALVARRRSVALSAELSRVGTDIEWNHDIAGALVRFANRVKVPRISRTVRLIVEANRSTSELHQVLNIAARDSSAQASILRERYREVSSYLAIIVIGFLVYLGIILLLDEFYLTTLAGGASEGVPGAPGTPVALGSFNVTDFRRLFFHSTLVQALFGGLIAGKMARNDVLSGVKISIALVLVTILAFVTV